MCASQSDWPHAQQEFAHSRTPIVIGVSLGHDGDCESNVDTDFKRVLHKAQGNICVGDNMMCVARHNGYVHNWLAVKMWM